jgi:hypothetical protein
VESKSVHPQRHSRPEPEARLVSQSPPEGGRQCHRQNAFFSENIDDQPIRFLEGEAGDGADAADVQNDANRRIVVLPHADLLQQTRLHRPLLSDQHRIELGGGDVHEYALRDLRVALRECDLATEVDDDAG